MKYACVAAAAAVSLGLVGVAPAAAKPDHDRVIVTRHTTVIHRAGGDNGHHYGWYKAHHAGWNHNRYQVCRSAWRHHHRERVCTWRER